MSRLPSILVSVCVLAGSGCVVHQSGPTAATLGDRPPRNVRSFAGQLPAAGIPTGFPTRCDAAEVQVMLLGTYHFENPGLDAVTKHIDDVLAPTRQREIADLVERLAACRVLVIVGAGHVPPMRNLLDEAPQLCPVSPLPLL